MKDWTATDVVLGLLAVMMFPFLVLLSVVAFGWIWRREEGE